MAWEFTNTPTVCICIPHTSTITFEWADHTYVPIKIPDPRFNKVYQMARGVPLNIAREQMILSGLASKEVTHFFFLDSDVVFEQPENVNDAIYTLLGLDSPIACGVYRAKQKTGFHYAIWVKEQGRPDGKLNFIPVNPPQPPQNWFTVDVSGLGCALIKREVFEKMPRPWFPWEFTDGGQGNEVGPSEDFNFFMNAKKYGYDCWIYSDVKCGHIGEIKMRYDGTPSVLDL